MKKATIAICVFVFIWANLGLLARAFIPFDPKVQKYIDQGGSTVSINEVLDIADSATSQFRSMGYGIIVLDLMVLYLAGRLLYLNKQQ